MPLSVRVLSPARLHLGLKSLKRAGGLGFMIDLPPEMQFGILITQASAFYVLCDSSLVKRVEAAAKSYAAAQGIALPPCRITIANPPLHHSGLGTGTAVAMAVARGLHRFRVQMELRADGYATMVDRGKRSGIGTWGAAHGGFIHDDFKRGDAVARMLSRDPFPDDWRVLLLIDKAAAAGLSGAREEAVFGNSPEVPWWKIFVLDNMAHHLLVPAIRRKNFWLFAKACYWYGYLAGTFYEKWQEGGVFATKRTAELVRTVRSMECGTPAVFQSSWGPTIAAIFPSEATASNCRDVLTESAAWSDLQMLICKPNNTGAQIIVEP